MHFAQGKIGKLQSIVPGPGPSGVPNNPTTVGDNPNLPRDPDKFEGDVDKQREFRERGIPSGLANEVYLDVYERLASFEPGVKNLQQRLFDAYAAEVARVDANGDGIISAVEGDIDTASDGFPDNRRLYPSRDGVQPVRRDARNQRRIAGAPLCAEPAGLGPAGIPGAGRSSGARVRRARRRRSIERARSRERRSSRAVVAYPECEAAGVARLPSRLLILSQKDVLLNSGKNAWCCKTM